MLLSYAARYEFITQLNAMMAAGTTVIDFYDTDNNLLASAPMNSSSPIASIVQDGDGSCVAFFDISGTYLKTGVSNDGYANRFRIKGALVGDIIIEGSIGDSSNGPEDIKFNDLDWTRGDYISITELSIKIKPGSISFVH